MYYMNGNELLNQDSKFIHPLISDLGSTIQLDFFDILLNIKFIELVLDISFLVLGINWSNQNLTWNFWWIWDLSEILIIISLIYCIVQIHDDDDNDNESSEFHEFFDSDIDTDDGFFTVFLFYFFIIQLINVSHSFITNTGDFITLWVTFFLISFFIDQYDDEIVFDDVLYGDLKISQNNTKNYNIFISIDILFLTWLIIEFHNYSLVFFFYYLVYSLVIIYNIFNIYNITKIKFILIHFIGIVVFTFFRNSSIVDEVVYINNTSWTYYNNIFSYMIGVSDEDSLILITWDFDTTVAYVNNFYFNIISYLVNNVNNVIRLNYYNTNHFSDYILLIVIFYYCLYFKKCNII